jgi:hypothetical protein
MSMNQSHRKRHVETERDPLGMINGEGIITGTVVSAAAIAAAVRESLAETWPILAAAVVPAVILIVVQLVGGTVNTAAWTAVIACTALLTIYSFVAGRRSGLSTTRSVGSAAVGALLGVLVIALKASLH